MKIFFFLISSLIHWFFRSEFSNLHVFLNFPKFLSLICSFITVQSEKMLNVILVFKILLNCFLSHCMILENVPERLSFHQQTISFCSFMSRKLTHIGHRHDKLNQVEGTQSQIPGTHALGASLRRLLRGQVNPILLAETCTLAWAHASEECLF